MKLYVARHARTNYNDLGLCNADPLVDVHLTETGIAQAKTLAEKLSDSTIDQIYVSELRRTQQTADFINKFHDVPIKIDSRLNDNRSGFESQPVSMYYEALNKADDRWTIRFGDGESIGDMHARVRGFLDKLRTQNYRTVLVITSEIIVQAINGILNDLPNQEAHDFQVKQGGYIQFELN